MIVTDFFRSEPILWPLLLVLAAIYIIPSTVIPDVVEAKVQAHYDKLPDIRIDFHPSRTLRNRFSTNRTALYIETRNDVKYATPLLLHMTQVIPPEWRFVFLGSEELLRQVNSSSPVQRMVDMGKLRLGNVERWTSNWKGVQDIHETHSRLLTNASFYEEQFPSVEWLLVFRSSAIMCANANRTVNDYLDFDWVGAPWSATDQFGGNGGLSIRRLSKVREILKFQTRQDGSDSEDRWLSRRLGLLPSANCANGTVEKGFAVEDVWHDNPLGYHLNPGLAPGKSANVWDNQDNRKRIFSYCPEIKMIMDMRLERERCPVEVEVVDPATGLRGIGSDAASAEADLKRKIGFEETKKKEADRILKEAEDARVKKEQEDKAEAEKKSKEEIDKKVKEEVEALLKSEKEKLGIDKDKKGVDTSAAKDLSKPHEHNHGHNNGDKAVDDNGSPDDITEDDGDDADNGTRSSNLSDAANSEDVGVES